MIASFWSSQDTKSLYTLQKRHTIIHLTSIEKEKRANAAFLIGCYCVRKTLFWTTR